MHASIEGAHGVRDPPQPLRRTRAHRARDRPARVSTPSTSRACLDALHVALRLDHPTLADHAALGDPTTLKRARAVDRLARALRGASGSYRRAVQAAIDKEADDLPFRHWLRAPRATPPAMVPAPPSHGRRKRPPRIFLPGTQLGADTTNLSAFGVALKLVRVQDIGGRDQRLFDAAVIDTRESPGHVIEAFRAVLKECPGMQAITDQGTPYLVEEIRAELRVLAAEHAPQKFKFTTGTRRTTRLADDKAGVFGLPGRSGTVCSASRTRRKLPWPM
jgi:hypothetical protein